MAENEEYLKSLLMRTKEESEKAGLKLNIKKTIIMASGPITSWPVDGGKVEAGTDFIFLGSKITVDFVLLEKTLESTLDCKEFEQTLGDSGGQRSLACYSPWIAKR